MPFDINQAELFTWVVNIVKAALILVAGLVIGRLARTWLLRLGMRRAMAVNAMALIANLVQIAVVLFSIVLILPTFGVDWTALLTLVGTVGLGVSLAAQDLLRNFIAGLYILMEQPFKIGDRVKVDTGSGVTGTVQSIELRVTNLRTENGEQVVVPNSLIFTNVLVNLSASNLQRHAISISVPESSLSDVTRRVDDTLRQFSDVSTSPAPSTTVESLAAGQLKLQVVFWTPPDKAHTAVPLALQGLREAFPQAEITVTG